MVIAWWCQAITWTNVDLSSIHQGITENQYWLNHLLDVHGYIDGLVQDCSNSIQHANALELLQSCANHQYLNEFVLSYSKEMHLKMSSANGWPLYWGISEQKQTACGSFHCMYTSRCPTVTAYASKHSQIEVEVIINGYHVADNIFRCIFLNENYCIFSQISLKSVPKGRFDSKSALVQ